MRRRTLILAATTVVGSAAAAFAQSPEELVSTGYRALSERDAAGAQAAFDKALMLEGAPAPLRARAFSGRALVGTLLNKPDTAMKDHEAALALETADPSIHAHRGVWYMYNGWLDQALKDFDEAIRMGAPVWGHYGRGMVYEMYNDAATSASEFAKARDGADPDLLRRIESEIGIFRQR